MPTLKEKLEIVEQQILEGKRVLSYALQYAGISAVSPNDNAPDVYETLQSYADKIRRLQLANSLIFEFTIPEENLTKYKRTVVLPMSGLNYNQIAQDIVNSDTGYTGTSTLALDEEEKNNPYDEHVIKDVWGNDITDGNYDIEFSEDELREYLSESETEEMMEAMGKLGIPVIKSSDNNAEEQAEEDIPDYQFTVDWGDGTTAEYNSSADINAIYHTYEQPGTYDVAINGFYRVIKNGNERNGSLIVDESEFLDKDGVAVFESSNYSMCNNLVKVIAWGNTRLRLLTNAFYGCRNLAQIPMYDTTNSFVDVTNCAQIFAYTALEEIPYDSNAERGLFSGCKKVTTFAGAFYTCHNLKGPIPPKLIENCSSCTNVGSMFAYSSKISGSIPVGMFDGMPNLTNASEVFAYTQVSGELPERLFPNNPKITTIAKLFYMTNVTGTIGSNFISSLSSLRDMRQAFYGCTGITAITADAFSGLTANDINCMQAFYNTGIREIPAGLIESMTGTGHTYVSMFSLNDNLVSIPSSIFSSMNNIRDARRMFDSCPNLTSSLPTPPPSGDWDNEENIRKWYGIFAQNTKMVDYSSIPLELGGNGDRKFTNRHVGAIVLADKTLVDPINYSYNSSNRPIGIVYTDNGDDNIRFMALGDLVRAWTDTQANCVDTPIPNTTSYTHYNWNRYSGKTYTEQLINWTGYTNDTTHYPAHRYANEYTAGNVSAGEWFIGDISDIWDMFTERGLLKNAADKIIAGGGGFSTSNCYTVRETPNGTVYWTTSEYSNRSGITIRNYGGYASTDNKWRNSSVRPVSVTTAPVGPIYNKVDLSLPSGTLWSDKNIGAMTEEEGGLFFQWG